MDRIEGANCLEAHKSKVGGRPAGFVLASKNNETGKVLNYNFKAVEEPHRGFQLTEGGKEVMRLRLTGKRARVVSEWFRKYAEWRERYGDGDDNS